MPAPNNSATPRRTTTPSRSERRVTNAIASAAPFVAEIAHQQEAQMPQLHELVVAEALRDGRLRRHCLFAHGFDAGQTGIRDGREDGPPVQGVGYPLDHAVSFEDVHDVGHGPR